jgi:hypothetical protein
MHGGLIIAFTFGPKGELKSAFAGMLQVLSPSTGAHISQRLQEGLLSVEIAVENFVLGSTVEIGLNDEWGSSDKGHVVLTVAGLPCGQYKLTAIVHAPLNSASNCPTSLSTSINFVIVE